MGFGRSLDGRALLVGECKWWSRPPDLDDFERLAEQMLRKPPPDAAAHVERVVRVAFVPERPPDMRVESPIELVTAEQVLRCLRDASPDITR
ncbi:MAG: hypothetical protein GF331_10205 [Chitinivibrionales bacterium]|nr:hypothetical protein [Chitinivibrionales bacterium]